MKQETPIEGCDVILFSAYSCSYCRKYLGFLSNDEFNKYLTVDTEFNKDCLRNVFVKKTETLLLRKKNKPSGTLNQEITITPQKKPKCEHRGREPLPTKCLRNIENGTCRDPFVIEHIGKVFFPDKYTKTK